MPIDLNLGLIKLRTSLKAMPKENLVLDLANKLDLCL